MKRPDLGMLYDGWQVLDPTPQERSAGQRSSLVVVVVYVHWMQWYSGGCVYALGAMTSSRLLLLLPLMVIQSMYTNIWHGQTSCVLLSVWFNKCENDQPFDRTTAEFFVYLLHRML